MTVVRAMLEKFGDNLTHRGKDFFHYQDNHWTLLTEDDTDKLIIEIGKIYEGKAKYGQLQSTFNTFKVHLPTPPNSVDMYSANPFQTCFSNGTLHAVREKVGESRYRLEFKMSDRQDYITNSIPYRYDKDQQEQNTEFERMVDRIFKGDIDAKDKIRALKQMFGACLMPLFPRIFLLVGKAGTGKSSLILPF